MDIKHTNRLLHETSPYLLQHSRNPVDWYPWGEEALKRAKQEDKPILLSIGYSACHWCHVMEHESFENESIARVMNENFVCIKVDREERPDLDHIYQRVVQILGGQGGWPLTVFLTPDQEPFWGGTYFPPEDSRGRPGFPRVLRAIADHYRKERSKVLRTATEIKSALDRVGDLGVTGQVKGDLSLVSKAAEKLMAGYEPVHGGFGTQPKFPNAKSLELLLRHYARTGDSAWLKPVTHTLRCMAEGGIYDQVGGGFHRYSVDDRWLVPHFEKMLYDNAFLSKILLETYQATSDQLFARIARETLDYVLREMTHPEGGFYSTQDADSEGEEGKFFVWTPGEVFEVVGDRAGAFLCDYCDVTGRGNFEHGKSILHVNRPVRDLAFEREVSEEEVKAIIAESKRKLFETREGRIKPFRDEKILTDWNGMMISSLALAAQVLKDEGYRSAARAAADFLLGHLCQGGLLLHTWKEGQSKLNGYLDDYAFLTQGLLDLYETTFDATYLTSAIRLTDTMVSEFWDTEEGGFFFTGLRHEKLVHRPKQLYDHSTPSGQSVAVFNLVRLYWLTGKEDYRDKAEKVFDLLADSMEQNPFGFTNLLCALDFHLSPPATIVLAGFASPAKDGFPPAEENMLAQIHSRYVPNKLVAAVPSGNDLSLPLFAGKTSVGGKPTAYLCRNFTCTSPVTDPEELGRELDR
ncbi:MAG: thioredoxin domain-containing protein [Armatimonadetes bacterium]|nr:thioredoxin domain-containing protein [Armatimonadota bacterium]